MRAITQIECHRGELLFPARIKTLGILADAQSAESWRFAYGTQQCKPIIVHIAGIRSEHGRIVLGAQQPRNRHGRH